MIQKIPAQLKQAVSLLHTGLVSIGLVAIGFCDSGEEGEALKTIKENQT
jgi:hypothetical protein